jgi:dCTP diphosphatase
MNYEKIKKEIQEFVDERDWEQFHTPKNLAMALSVEVSELLEIFQWQKADDYKNANEKEKEMIKDEIADIFYYLVRISEKLDINVEEAFLNKMKKNRYKYPKELVKGKAVKINQK